MIIGLTGQAGCGKDTVADHIANDLIFGLTELSDYGVPFKFAGIFADILIVHDYREKSLGTLVMLTGVVTSQ